MGAKPYKPVEAGARGLCGASTGSARTGGGVGQGELQRRSVPACGHQHGLEFVFGHARLLRADVLHVEAEDAGEFGEVVGIAAGLDQLRQFGCVTRPHDALLR